MNEGEKSPPPTRIDVKATPITGHMRLHGQLSFLSYPQKLLRSAQDLINEGEYSIAVVVMHMACEVATEQALGKAFHARGISDLEAAVERFLNGYNLANSRIKQLYTSLTNDLIDTQPFWKPFTESAEWRNQIVHGTLTVDKSKAETSLDATSKLVAHLIKGALSA